MPGADVRDFEAVDRFRRSLRTYAETVGAALEDAEADARRCLAWLETEAPAHWKTAKRAATESLSRAKDAYRQKSLFKDSTGARSSAVDELQEVRRCERRLEECEEADAATRRHAQRVRHQIDDFRGGSAALRNLLESAVPRAEDDLVQVAEMLRQYAQLRPEHSAATRPAAPASAARTASPATGDLAMIPILRTRTPGSASRRGASGEGRPPSIRVPAEAGHVAAARAEDAPPPGRYEWITLAIESGDTFYIERVDAADDSDAAWHVGPALAEATPTPLATTTTARTLGVSPGFEPISRLPIGWLVLVEGGVVTRLVDPLDRVAWPKDDVAPKEEA